MTAHPLAAKPSLRTWRPRRAVLWLSLPALVGGVTIGGIFAVLWWQDAPLRQAENALLAGDYSRALQSAEHYLKQYPDSGRAVSLKARACAGLGRWQDVLRLFERAGAETPTELHVWAQALLHEQRWGNAVPLLKRLLQINPDDADVLHELTAAYGHLGYFEEALVCAQRLAEQPEFSARGYVLLGTLYYKLGNDERAAKAWNSVLQHAPEAEDLQVRPEEFFLEYGRTLLNVGNPGGAARQLERSRQHRPGAEVEALLGRCFEQLGELDRAAGHWQAAVRFDARDRTAREGLARLALGRRAPDEALAWLRPLLTDSDLRSSTTYLAQRACAFHGDEEQTNYWLERTEKLRRREDRELKFDQWLTKSPHSFWSRAVRAWRFAQSGNWYQAAQIVQQLQADSPGKPFVRDLAESIRTRGPLPSLDQIPLK